jgi:hypothetical protein
MDVFDCYYLENAGCQSMLGNIVEEDIFNQASEKMAREIDKQIVTGDIVTDVDMKLTPIEIYGMDQARLEKKLRKTTLAKYCKYLAKLYVETKRELSTANYNINRFANQDSADRQAYRSLQDENAGLRRDIKMLKEVVLMIAKGENK